MKSNAASTPRRYEQAARAKSTEETGRRIVEAFIERLLTQWYDEITLDAVAKDAGVTVQTVLRRFDGKEGLLATAVETIGARINAARMVPAGDVEGAVDAVVGDYERTGDAVIRLLALEGRHPAVKRVTDLGRSEHRGWVSTVFAESLRSLDAAARQRMVDALVIATDVYTWKLLRRDMGRGVGATKTIVKNLVQAALVEAAETK